MNIHFLPLALAILILLAACGGAPAVVGSRSTGAPGGEVALSERLDEMGYSDKTEIKRLSNFRLNGWNYVDNYHVVINSGPSKQYLVQFRSACRDLRRASSISFKTALGSVSRGDKMIIHDMGDWAGDCGVSAVFELTRKPREDEPEE